MSELEKDLYDEEEDTQKGKYLTFTLGEEEFGIEIKFVTEIIGIQPITHIPELPLYMKGIINLRGKIIPVMDVRLKFKKEEKGYNDRTCIIVIDANGTSVGLIVDSVAEVSAIPDEDIVPPPEVNKGSDHRYIKAIGKVGNEVILMLDCERFLSESEQEQIQTKI